VNKKHRGRWPEVVAAALLTALTLGTPTRATADPLTVAVRPHLIEEYDDNIFFQKNKVDDYITELALGLNLLYQTPSSTTILATGISGNYFARRTVTNVDLAAGQRLSYSTNYQYSPRLSFTINDRLIRLNSNARTLGFVNTPETTMTTTNIAALDPAQANPGEVNVLLPHGSAFTNSASVGANYLLSPLWTGSLTYANGVSRFSNPSSTDLTQRVNLGLAYQWDPDLSLNTAVSYSYFNASNAPDSNGYTATVGASYTFAPQWSAFASVGASLNQPVGSGRGSTTPRATFSVGLDRAFERSSLTAGAQQGLTPSAGVAGTSNTTGGYVRYQIQLAEYLSGMLHTSYTNFDTSSGSFSAYQLHAGLFYPVWRRVNAALVYGYRRSDSRHAISNILEAGVVDGNIVSIQIGATFDLWQLDV
jgi:hypothetical protein